MSKLKKDLGMAILFITHDLGLVKEFSDQVCVMQNGKIVESGDTESVFNNPQHAYTQKLLSAEPEPKEDINNNEDPLIEINNLNVYYDMPRINFFKKNRFHAVKDTSLNIYKNTTIGLVGESGSGKSTLGKAIANLTKFEGEISFNGRKILNNNPNYSRNLGIQTSSYPRARGESSRSRGQRRRTRDGGDDGRILPPPPNPIPACAGMPYPLQGSP